MNNPRIKIALDTLGIDGSLDMDKVFLLYSGKEHLFNCSLYLDYSLFGGDEVGNLPLDYQVDANRFLKLLSSYTSIQFIEGTDRESVYLGDSHRKVLDIRYVLPEGYLQMDLEDEFVNTPTDESISDYLRSLITLN